MEAAYKLAAALNVSEMWLGGYDVPMDRTQSAIKNDQLAELVIRMRKDPEFFEAVSNLAKLEAAEFASINLLLSSLGDK
jgi:hypothetical protein